MVEHLSCKQEVTSSNLVSSLIKKNLSFSKKSPKKPYITNMATHGEILFFEEGSKEPVIFYQHWDGSDLLPLLAETLRDAGEEFVNDPSALSRLICQMMLDFDRGREGFAVTLIRVQCFTTIEVYASWSEEPEFVVDGQLYDLKQFIRTFAVKATA